MMRRTDLLNDPRFATAPLRRQNLDALLAEVRAWILTFTDLEELQAQVSEQGLAIGVVRSTSELAESEWAADWGAIVEVDNRAGGTMRMPGPPWRFSGRDVAAAGHPGISGRAQRRIARGTQHGPGADPGTEAAQDPVEPQQPAR